MLCGVLRRLGISQFLLLVPLVLAPLCGAADPPENVLVLPFSNLSANHNLDWVGESFAVSVFQSLSSALPFVVQPEDRDNALRQMNVRKYAPLTKASVIEIAINLDAVFVVSGSVEALPGGNGARDSLRVHAQLYNARKLRHVKDFDVSGKMDDLSLIQSHLAWQLLSALRPEGAPIVVAPTLSALSDTASMNESPAVGVVPTNCSVCVPAVSEKRLVVYAV